MVGKSMLKILNMKIILMLKWENIKNAELNREIIKIDSK